MVDKNNNITEPKHDNPRASQTKGLTDESKNKLVNATELPLHGNPHPPKDIVEVEEPGMLELKVRTLRIALEPYLGPVGTVFTRTKDFMSTGISHTQSTLQGFGLNQESSSNTLIILGSGLLGLAVARRKGTFKRFLIGSLFFSGAYAACYPNDAQKVVQMGWCITKNKLPELAKQQYEKFSANKSKDTAQLETSPKSVE